MRDNWHVRLVGTAVTLVPYRRHHVATYHGWMQDEELLAATASEPLSLEEEYDMQRSWRDDGGKSTFLIAVGGGSEGGGGGGAGGVVAGDVNLYLNAALPDAGDDADVPEGAWEEEEEEAPRVAPAHEYATPSGYGHNGVAEVSVMIAVDAARRNGAASEAVRIIADWARRNISVHTLVARIGKDNTASIAMFESRLGFRRAYECSVFGEVTFVLELGDAAAERAKREEGNDAAPIYQVEEDVPSDPEDIL